MRRNSHDRAGTVAHHDVVSRKDRDLLPVDRVDGSQPIQPDTSLVLDKLGALEFSLLGTLFAVILQLVPVPDLVLMLVEKRMLRRDNHKGDPKERVTPGCINAETVIGSLDREVDESTL